MCHENLKSIGPYLSGQLGEDIIEHINGKCHMLHYIKQENDVEDTNVRCHLCTLWSTCREFCDIGIHLITLYSCQGISKPT